MYGVFFLASANAISLLIIHNIGGAIVYLLYTSILHTCVIITEIWTFSYHIYDGGTAMRQNQKWITTLLVLAMLTSAFTGCGQTEETTTIGDDTTPVTENATEEETSEVFDTGLEAIDYEGATVTFMIRDENDVLWISRELAVEEENGEAINDAVFRRNVLVEEKYNITIAWDWQLLGNQSTMLTKIVASNDDQYDCVMTSIQNSSTAGVNKELYDLNTLDNFDFTATWWDTVLNDSSTIANRLYYAIGDMNLMTHDGTSAMFFNKELVADYNLVSPYTLVEEGKWTIDQYTNMTVDFSKDLNGDGVLGKEDLWGSTSPQDTTWALLVSCGGNMAYKDKDDLPVFHMLDEPYINILNKIAGCCNVGKTFNGQYVEYNGNRDCQASDNTNIFGEGRALFLTAVVIGIQELRNYDTTFGIVPFPKYDEAQEVYITAVNGYASTATAIPVTVQEIDRITRILEDMACHSRELLRTAYYDVTLQAKLTRDEESVEMLDIIFSNRVLDLGWANNFGNVQYSGIYNQIKSGNNDFASAFAKIQSKAESDVEKLIKAYLDK